MNRLMLVVFAGIQWVAAHAADPSPYTGQQQREIKALSSDEIASYLAGKGAGFAKAAELNHYPGPRHVLDLAEQLELSAEQKDRSQAIFDSMQSRAISLGTQLVDKERELDRRFAAREIDAASLDGLLSEIGKLQRDLRYVHLSAHLEEQALLTAEQSSRYDRLRGYDKREASMDHSHQH